MSQFYYRYNALFLAQHPTLKHININSPPQHPIKLNYSHAYSINCSNRPQTSKNICKAMNGFFSSRKQKLDDRVDIDKVKQRDSVQIRSNNQLYMNNDCNKYVKLEPLKMENNTKRTHSNYDKVKPVKSNKQPNYYNHASTDETQNPEQYDSPIKFQTKQRNKKTRKLYSKRYETQIANQRYKNNRYQPQQQKAKEHKSIPWQRFSLQYQPRQNYGYPQVNYQQIFDEYKGNNQYKFINKKLSDIKWIQNHNLKGTITFYHEALMRRNQSKKNILTRRNKLRKLLGDEEREFKQFKSILQ